ncbi:MAG: hypothetical protein R2867_13705 [Caldilineaceae bacterium]
MEQTPTQPPREQGKSRHPALLVGLACTHKLGERRGSWNVTGISEMPVTLNRSTTAASQSCG